MAKQVEVKVNNFSGGVSDDSRANSTTQFTITKHFDIFLNQTDLYHTVHLKPTQMTVLLLLV